MYHFREFYPAPLLSKKVHMDPDCAICHAPATMACDCEAKGLETAIRQAEARVMQGIYNEIRAWVRAHAQDYILEYFRLLTERRKKAHAAHIDNITRHAATYYAAPPHPSELAAAQQALKHGIDEDWQASVQRYPEVLQYFYSLVEFQLPADDEPGVRDPPLSALRGNLQPLPKRRMSAGGAPTIASGHSMHAEREFAGRRTPPPGFGPPRAADRRTPGPLESERRRSFGRMQPPPAPGYYGHPGGGYY